MKPGRNDPCPCGSGKKYKYCCLNADDGRALVWRRIRRAIDGFPSAMLQFVTETYGPVAIEEAWDEFNLWDTDEPFGEDTPHFGPFLSWLIYVWAPDPAGTEVAGELLHGVRPIDAFKLRNLMHIDPLLQLYTESCADRPFSFYEVEHIQPGRGFSVRDLFTGERHQVLERSGAEHLQPGEVLYALLAHMEGLTLVEACGPVAFPPIARIEVIELREHLNAQVGHMSIDVLANFEDDVRELYLMLTEHCLHPPMPKMQNTDGEAMVLQRLIFDIDSTQAVFDALKHLDFDSTEAELLAQGQRDDEGNLRSVPLCWKRSGNAQHAEWSNTILGHIEISDRRLTVQVNSEERAQAFRQLAERTLGRQARYRMSEVQSAAKLMSQALEQPSVERNPDDDEFLRHPDLAAHMNQTIAAYYEHWVDESLPALAGQTPREAALDAVGQEKVEALIREIEHTSASMKPAPDPVIFNRLRQTLGLPVDDE